MSLNHNKRNSFFRNGKFKYFNKNRGRWFGSEKRPRNFDHSKEDKLNSTAIPNKDCSDSTFNNCPYKGWNLYFTGLDYVKNSSTIDKVKIVETFFKENSNLFNVFDVERTLTFSIDVSHFYNNSKFKSEWESFEDDLENNPSHTISCIGLAIHQVILIKLKEASKYTSDEEETDIELPTIQIRILNFGPVLQLKNLKSNCLGKLITVKGTITRVGSIKMICTWMTFRCDKCGAVQFLKLIDGLYNAPMHCVDRECNSKTFSSLLSSPYTITLNWQSIRVQEIVTEEYREGGRVPRTIDCELTADLVDSCAPGDVAILTGILKMKNDEEGLKQKGSNIFHQYIDVVSIVNCKNFHKGGIPGIEFSERNYHGIKEIFAEENLFCLIVQSLCPSIFGHEIVKAGLVLSMFGGCQRYEECRANPHVLIVGDPGLGKSKILQACASAAPRGVYVCGNTSTTSGLTVTLTRESGGDYSLEAGALILSDQGCCCIDEFDKMSSQHQALLEAMEQQTVSIAKSGVVCALPCRVSILAAANPVGGHFNKGKTISENLKLGASLLSRFDLIFILMDEPSVQADSMLSDHVIAMHSASKGSVSTSSKIIESSFDNKRLSLSERLKVQPGEELDLIPHQLLRKYIAYAKQYVKPELSNEAMNILIEFYMKLRHFHQDWDGAPVTPRLLESLIRFTEARAKLELREEANASDAEDVVEILKHSLLDISVDVFNSTTFQKSSRISNRKQAQKFIRVLKKSSEIQGKSVFTVEELQEIAKTTLIDVDDFFYLLNTLNVQGYLLKKGSQVYELLNIE